MTFQSVPDTAVAEVIQAFNIEGAIQNNLYFHFDGGYDEESLVELANAVADFWAGYVMPELATALTLYQVHVRGLSEELDLQAYAENSIPTAGGVASPIMPANVAWVLKFESGFVGRSARGRIFLGGFTESKVVGNLIDGTTANNIKNAFAAHLDDDLPVGCSHVIVSRYHNGAPRSPAVTLPVVSYAYTDIKVDTQRRRLKHTA